MVFRNIKLHPKSTTPVMATVLCYTIWWYRTVIFPNYQPMIGVSIGHFLTINRLGRCQTSPKMNACTSHFFDVVFGMWSTHDQWFVHKLQSQKVVIPSSGQTTRRLKGLARCFGVEARPQVSGHSFDVIPTRLEPLWIYCRCRHVHVGRNICKKGSCWTAFIQLATQTQCRWNSNEIEWS